MKVNNIFLSLSSNYLKDLSLDLKDKTNWGRMKDAHNVASAGATTSKGALILEDTYLHFSFKLKKICDITVNLQWKNRTLIFKAI